jgi:hypothetical protein
MFNKAECPFSSIIPIINFTTQGYKLPIICLVYPVLFRVKRVDKFFMKMKEQNCIGSALLLI